MEGLAIEGMVEKVRQIAYDLHVYLGNGYLEKVYENALRHRLGMAGFDVETQRPIVMRDEDGFIIGEYFADLVVNGNLIVELKATKALAPEHYAQTINYLKATGRGVALLINFGAYKFEVRKIVFPPSTRSPILHG